MSGTILVRSSETPQSIYAIYDMGQVNTPGDEASARTLSSGADNRVSAPPLAAARPLCRRRRRRPALRNWGSGGTADGKDEGHDRGGGGVTVPEVWGLGFW